MREILPYFVKLHPLTLQNTDFRVLSDFNRAINHQTHVYIIIIILLTPPSFALLESTWRYASEHLEKKRKKKRAMNQKIPHKTRSPAPGTYSRVLVPWVRRRWRLEEPGTMVLVFTSRCVLKGSIDFVLFGFIPGENILYVH